jgi:putative SOS response-associated peptidase YedK
VTILLAAGTAGASRFPYPDARLATFTIITTDAADDVAHVHDRMPMNVAREHWADWLDPGPTTKTTSVP